MQASNSSGCRNDIALHGGWDTHSSALGLQTQQIPTLRQAPTAVGERGNDPSSCFLLTMGNREIGVVVLVSEVDSCSLQGPPDRKQEHTREG
jgi:hypothetical protein